MAVHPEKILTMVLLVSLMLQTGLQVNLDHLLAALKNYGLLGRALLANFILVPLFAVALVRLLHLDDMIAAGILLMAIAPGVPFLVRSGGRTHGGSLSFALCLAILMPALSTITVPVTATLVLPVAAQADIPDSFLANVVLFQLFPLLLGIAVAHGAPALAEKLAGLMSGLVVLCIFVVLIALAPAIGKAVASVHGSRGLVTALLLSILAIAAGWALGGPDANDRRTLAIGTTLRNVGLASVVATNDFPGTPVAAMVMCYLIVQIVVSAIAGKVFSRGQGLSPHIAVG